MGSTPGHGMSPSELRERLAQLRVIDVREPDEVAAGTIPGAVAIPFARLEQAIAIEFEANEEMVFVCTYGGRSSSAAGTMAARGFTRARFLDGGLDAWVRAGFELNRR